MKSFPGICPFSGMDENKKLFCRILFRKTCRYLGTGLAFCAVIGGFGGELPYLTWALCAAGALFLAYGWFTYLEASGPSVLKYLRRPQKRKIPEMFRNNTKKKHYRPAFLRDNTDFDDDLTAAVSVDEEFLTKKELARLRIFSRMSAGVLLFILSFVL